MNTPVSFPLAKLLKEKGFDINVGTAFKYTFKEGHIEDEYMNVASWNDVSGVILRPTISDVVMWLYEKYNIWISVDKMLGSFVFTIVTNENNWDINPVQKFFESPEEAYEAAIEHALNNLI